MRKRDINQKWISITIAPGSTVGIEKMRLSSAVRFDVIPFVDGEAVRFAVPLGEAVYYQLELTAESM